MHVGLLTTSYPRFPGDVAGNFVRGFACALRARGHQVDVLAPADDQKRPIYDAAHIRYLPRAFRRTFYEAGVPDNVRHPRAWPGLFAFPVALALSSTARPWDAVVSHFGVPSAMVGALVARGRPHLAVWHSADVSVASSLGRMRAVLPRLATRHWCVTASARDRLGLEKAIVSPMGAHLPTARRDASRRQLGIGEKECVVSFVGRLVPIKGLGTLVDVAAGLPLRVVIAGDGPERRALEARAQKVGANVCFLGQVGSSKREQILAASDAFAMPSIPIGHRVEGAPCAVLEAQLAALPILASRTGGLVERVRHGVDGVLLTPGAHGEWRRALQSLIRGDYAKMGPRAAQANAHLTWSALAPIIERALWENA